MAIYFTKLIALHFFLSLAGGRPRRKLVEASILSLFVWLPIATIVTAVQCQAPSVWLSEPGRCINQVSCVTHKDYRQYSNHHNTKTVFWIFNAVIDCISQIEVALLPIFLLHDLQSAKSKKRFAMLAFSPNIL